MSKGAIELTKWLFAVMVIFSFVAGLYMIFSSGGQTVERGAKISRRKLRVVGLYTKLISSSNCLSIGEAGILNKTLLDQKNGTTLSCTYLPGFKTYLEVGTAPKGGFGGGFNWTGPRLGDNTPPPCKEVCEDAGGVCAPRCGKGNDYAQKRTYTGGGTTVIDRYVKCSEEISTDATTYGLSWCCCGKSGMRSAKEHWVFGDNFVKKIGALGGITLRLGIQNSRGKVVPGKLNLFYLYADNQLTNPYGQLLAFTRAVAVAERTGKSNITMEGDEWRKQTLQVKSGGEEVCMRAHELELSRGRPRSGDEWVVCKELEKTEINYIGPIEIYPDNGMQAYKLIIERVDPGEVEIVEKKTVG